MANNQIWVLVANASEAKLYAAPFLGKELSLIEEFSHPESRNKGSDLTSDKVGHYQSNSGVGSAHGAFVEPTDPKQFEAVRFAHELANRLEKGRTSNLYAKLVVIAPPQFHGLLKKECNGHIQNLVMHYVDKDYTKLTEGELVSMLEELPRY